MHGFVRFTLGVSVCSVTLNIYVLRNRFLKDACFGVRCAYYAVCIDGKCVCIEGTSGDPYDLCTPIDIGKFGIKCG